MAFENKAGLNVFNQYGIRNTGGTVGIAGDEYDTIEIEFTGESIASAFLPPVVVPQGALFRRAVLRINEAFALTGTTPAISFGGTAPATNGFSLSKAELEAIGTKVPASTGAGTWATNSATGTTSAEKITRVLTGTTPVVDPLLGKGILTLEFYYQKK